MYDMEVSIWVEVLEQDNHKHIYIQTVVSWTDIIIKKLVQNKL